MKKVLSMVLVIVMLLAMLPAVFAEELADHVDSGKKVSEMEVYQMPDKTVYVIGDEFSVEGGIVKVIYADGSYDLVPMTCGDLKVSAPTMNTAASKNVQISIGKKRVVFKIEVAGAMCDVTFAAGYEGGADTLAQVTVGTAVEKPADPTREGYTFCGWYADVDYTALYDFSTPVASNVTLCALWTKDGAEQVNVTFDYDFYGAKLTSYSYPVEAGTAVKQPAADPVRTGYTFDKWVDASGNAFDFSAPLTADTTITAAWTKTVDGVQTWTFEAEDTDLTGKIGPSYSGSAQETSMIIFNDKIEASNDRVVGYLYEKGISLEFYLASDSDVDDATVYVRIAGEFTTMTYGGEDYQVIVNGEAKNYSPVTIEIASNDEVSTCDDLIVVKGVSLKKGANTIQLMTNNVNSISGTTFKANAPMVDCVKVATSAVVTWDETMGEPAANYKK